MAFGRSNSLSINTGATNSLFNTKPVFEERTANRHHLVTSTHPLQPQQEPKERMPPVPRPASAAAPTLISMTRVPTPASAADTTPVSTTPVPRPASAAAPTPISMTPPVLTQAPSNTQQNQTSQPPAPSGGLFGSNNTATSQPQQTGGGLFGGGNTTSQPQQQGGLFGRVGTSQPQQSGGLFGGGAATSQPQQSGGLFGNTNTSQPQQSGGLFGGGATSQPQQSGGLFGNTATSQPQQSGGLFGNTATSQPQQSGGLFGNTTTSQPQQSGGLFGNTTNNTQQNTGGGLFGASTANRTGGGLFGASTTNNAPNNNTSSLFGGGGNSLFGGASTQQPQQQQQQQNQPSNTFLGMTATAPQFNQPSLLGAPQYRQSQTNPFQGRLTLGQSGSNTTTVGGGAQSQGGQGAVQVNYDNLKSTTRFSDLVPEVQQTLERIDAMIQAQERFARQIEAFVPKHGQDVESLKPDVELVSEKNEAIETALSLDARGVEGEKGTLQKDISDGERLQRVIDNLRQPPQFHSRGGDPGGRDLDLIGNFFNPLAGNMSGAIDTYGATIAEVEAHMHILEQSAMASGGSGARGGGIGGGFSSVRELAETLGAFEEGILGAAGVVGQCREGVNELVLGGRGRL
ncbi:uncharacterized protein LTR77_009266 [Saxophila tyrrhenica]|uniref:Nucleoporin NUP49/NSP49 n=1 Tax=Saxophila tyrrhenica TaxID=1690608 RepID=A0AAV9P2Q0_9PEZI|nr:hypothetical protein LTR77_009266 [Saxophila tyrrhenica]